MPSSQAGTLVCELHSLTADEIKIVESTVK
jgi:hypothetical protein